ncbi:uncharacterized protein LOC118433422 [Folsomia candida]|uniref:uncharacterized protein LOC118433422 n=1 Tax=Folsomia candida TaxID=158441 RepID=UPI00160517FE|nr:uncharacterized protein LOC118433422 [Folsomia candida]
MDIELRFLGRDHNFKTSRQFVYCVLPYIEGQRYTFGHSYQPCGSGEEFLYLLRIRLFGKEKEAARFQISCRRGKFWIKRLSNAQNYAIFLNETEVCDTTDGMKLSIGDILVVAEHNTLKYSVSQRSWLNPRWKLFSKENTQRKNRPGNFQHTCVFTFQARRIPTTFDSPAYHASMKFEYFPRDATESYNALENTLILSKIFSHLGLPTLKNCRLVSSLWDSEAVPWLKSRSEIRFKFYAYREPAKSTRFFLYRHEMLPFTHPNWHVDRIDTGETVTFCKLSVDFDMVVENCGVIRRLSCVYCPTINNLLLTRLLNRLSSSLEELSICFENCGNAGDDITEFFPFIEFPLLKRFEIDMDPNVSTTIRPSKYENLTRSLIKLSSKVSALYLKSYSAPMNAHFLQEIVSDKGSYPRLREVRIKKVNSEGIKVLRGFRTGLVRLEINWFSDECEIRQVEEIVQRQRESLEFLRLEVPPYWGLLGSIPVELPYLKRKDILFRRV